MSPGILDVLGGLNGLSGLIPRGLNTPGMEPTQPAPTGSFLNVEDGDAAYNTAAEVYALLGAAAAGFKKIWEKTVEAQVTRRWGFGSPTLPANQGYMYFFLLDTGTDFAKGTVRLVQAKAREQKSWVVKEIDDTRLHLIDTTSVSSMTPTDKNTMIALPEQVGNPEMGEDSLLQVWYSCRARATTEDAAAFSLPVTIRQ